MNRLFACTCSQFPYGDASSNYLRNFALAVKHRGWEVIVIGRGENREEDHTPEGYVFQGIRYENLALSQAGPKNFLNLYFRYSVYLEKVLRRYNIGRSDYIYIYSDFLDMARGVRKLVPLGHISYSAVEWFQPFQYKRRFLDPMYLLWRYSFFYKTRRLNKVFPISRELERHYRRHGCRTCLLPVLVDAQLEQTSDPPKGEDGLTHFIYPGIGLNNDSLKCMIGALYRMPQDKLRRMVLHFTILKEAVLREELGDKAYQLERVREALVFHGWLDYDVLLALYRSMDFVLIARAKNKVTVSNFPSKIPELMRLGVVPVCSDVGDYAQLYLTDRENALLFQGAAEPSCCAALMRAIDMPRETVLKMKSCASTCVCTRLGYQQWAQRIESFLLLPETW